MDRPAGSAGGGGGEGGLGVVVACIAAAPLDPAAPAALWGSAVGTTTRRDPWTCDVCEYGENTDPTCDTCGLLRAGYCWACHGCRALCEPVR